MNKDKLLTLETAMEVKTRDNGDDFHCFSDNAPQELTDLFLEEYDVMDLDYQIFSKACDTIVEAWSYQEEKDKFDADYVTENYNEFASPYNAVRLSYLNPQNDSDIAEISKNYSCESISLACAIWYDEQVQNAIRLIIDEYLLKQ